MLSVCLPVQDPSLSDAGCVTHSVTALPELSGLKGRPLNSESQILHLHREAHFAECTACHGSGEVV